MYFYEVNLYGKAHPPPDSQFSVLYSSLPPAVTPTHPHFLPISRYAQNG